MNWSIAVILVLGSVSCSIPGLLAQYRPFYSGYGRNWNFGGGYGFNSRYRGYPSFQPSGLGGYLYNRGLQGQGGNGAGLPGFQYSQPATQQQQQEDPLWRLMKANPGLVTPHQPSFGSKSTTKGPNVGQPNVLQPSSSLLSTGFTPAGTTRLTTEPTTSFRQFDNFFPQQQQQQTFNNIDSNTIEVDALPRKAVPAVAIPALSPAAAPAQVPQAPFPVAAPQTQTANNFFSNEAQQQFQPNLRDIDIPPPEGFPLLSGNQLGPIHPDMLEFLKPVAAVPGLPFQPSVDLSNMSREEMENVMRFLQFQPFILEPVPAVPELPSRN